MSESVPGSPPFPIFIIGSPRSGTSMLHWALCQQERLWGSEESELFTSLTAGLQQTFDEARRFKGRNWLDAQGVDQQEFMSLLGQGVNALYASRAGNCHWLEQTPSNTWVLPAISQMFPRARYLFIHRDGRQVVESMMSLWKWPFKKSARTWADANRRAMDFEASEPGHVLRVAYESLVQNPHQGLAPIWQFLDLEPCEQSHGFITDRDPINTSPNHAGQDRMQKLEPRYLGWSGSRSTSFRKIAGDEMLALGYALSAAR